MCTVKIILKNIEMEYHFHRS